MLSLRTSLAGASLAARKGNVSSKRAHRLSALQVTQFCQPSGPLAMPRLAPIACPGPPGLFVVDIVFVYQFKPAMALAAPWEAGQPALPPPLDARPVAPASADGCWPRQLDLVSGSNAEAPARPV